MPPFERVRLLVVLVVVGAVLDVGVFAFQLTENQRINANAAKNDCWSRVLDHAVTYRPSEQLRGILEAEARQCVKLP